MTTLAELKALDADVCDAVDVLNNAMAKAQHSGLIVAIETLEQRFCGNDDFKSLVVIVKAPMALLDTLES